MTKHKLPPYGRKILNRLNDKSNLHRWMGTSPDGIHATIWVCIGLDPWSTAKSWIHRRLILVAPPSESPYNFDWSVCKGNDPILIVRCGECREQEIHALADTLLRDGVERVIDTLTLARYIKGVRHAE